MNFTTVKERSSNIILGQDMPVNGFSACVCSQRPRYRKKSRSCAALTIAPINYTNYAAHFDTPE